MKTLPIGIDNFKELIENNYYYIDKTRMIEHLLTNPKKVTLITRPRRFGKTLNMSMIKYFFEIQSDNKELFKDTYIYKTKFMEQQGTFPVIDLTFKDCKGDSWQEVKEMLIETITDELSRYEYLLKIDDIRTKDKLTFERLITNQASDTEIVKSVLMLSRLLQDYYQTKCIILLDEYDVPIESARHGNFYNEAIGFISKLLSITFKQNEYMHLGLITGCLRIGKESIFTGWNNLKVETILNKTYARDFGITMVEMGELLTYYNMKDNMDTVRAWYNGYNFGDIDIYNPWDLVNFIDDKLLDKNADPKSYWVNTSSNDIIHDLLKYSDSETKMELEELLKGGTITKSIDDSCSYKDYDLSSLWSILLFTGYLTGKQVEKDQYKLRIPNKSIRECFVKQITRFNECKFKEHYADVLQKALINGDTITVEHSLNEYMNESLSQHDTKENGYHLFLSGVCSNLVDYKVVSNREAGRGRSDIILVPAHNQLLPGIIFELKYASSESYLDSKAESAYKQIEEKEYQRYFGVYTERPIVKYGIAFCGKICKVHGN